ncbi:MAG: hypothetical protein J3K34DRAFT_49708 [Monoraphidium minutum]|nr:MAG: hypothetical protein J3K34DRAFT_49708 [Monoraphidium minutum]
MCQTQRKQGTSMATPVVAGSAALARQYFASGFYPSGGRDAGAAYTPSGVLLKAALVGGASNMVGYTELSLPLEPAPSFRQGFGRLNLTSALPVGGIAPGGWRMQIIDLASLSEREAHRYCVRVTGPTTVTLAWYDWPASPAAGVTLQNDLDLVVTPLAAKGLKLRGNAWHDNLNTVERVTDIPAGYAQIEVSAPRVIAYVGTQKYALVVQGMFEGALTSEDGRFNPDPAARAAPRECPAAAPVLLAAAPAIVMDAPAAPPIVMDTAAAQPAVAPAAVAPLEAPQSSAPTLPTADEQPPPGLLPLASPPAPPEGNASAGGNVPVEDAVAALLVGMGARPASTDAASLLVGEMTGNASLQEAPPQPQEVPPQEVPPQEAPPPPPPAEGGAPVRRRALLAHAQALLRPPAPRSGAAVPAAAAALAVVAAAAAVFVAAGRAAVARRRAGGGAEPLLIGSPRRAAAGASVSSPQLGLRPCLSGKPCGRLPLSFSGGSAPLPDAPPCRAAALSPVKSDDSRLFVRPGGDDAPPRRDQARRAAPAPAPRPPALRSAVSESAAAGVARMWAGVAPRDLLSSVNLVVLARTASSVGGSDSGGGESRGSDSGGGDSGGWGARARPPARAASESAAGGGAPRPRAAGGSDIGHCATW